MSSGSRSSRSSTSSSRDRTHGRSRADRRARAPDLEAVQVGGALADAHHGLRSLDLLYVVREHAALRADAARPLGHEVRHRGAVLHAPQVRPQGVPGAVTTWEDIDLFKNNGD